MNFIRNKNIYLNLQNVIGKHAAYQLPNLQQIVLTPIQNTMDERSHKGQFGWTTIGDSYIPYIFRNEVEKFTIFRVVNDKIISQYFRFFNQDLFNLFSVTIHVMTEVERRLFNEINTQHACGYLATKSFSTADKLILLEDAIELHRFLKFCFDRLILYKNEGPAGFIRFGSDNMVPYLTLNEKKYMPTLYFEGETQMLSANMSSTITGYPLTWFQFLMRLQNVQKELMNNVRIVEFEVVQKFFPSNTVYTEDFVPVERNSFARPANNRNNYKSPKIHLMRPIGDVAESVYETVTSSNGIGLETSMNAETDLSYKNITSTHLTLPATSALEKRLLSECPSKRSPKFTAGNNKGRESSSSPVPKVADAKFKLPPPYNRSVAKKKTSTLRLDSKTGEIAEAAKTLPDLNSHTLYNQRLSHDNNYTNDIITPKNTNGNSNEFASRIPIYRSNESQGISNVGVKTIPNFQPNQSCPQLIPLNSVEDMIKAARLRKPIPNSFNPPGLRPIAMKPKKSPYKLTPKFKGQQKTYMLGLSPMELQKSAAHHIQTVIAPQPNVDPLLQNEQPLLLKTYGHHNVQSVQYHPTEVQNGSAQIYMGQDPLQNCYLIHGQNLEASNTLPDAAKTLLGELNQRTVINDVALGRDVSPLLENQLDE